MPCVGGHRLGLHRELRALGALPDRRELHTVRSGGVVGRRRSSAERRGPAAYSAGAGLPARRTAARRREPPRTPAPPRRTANSGADRAAPCSRLQPAGSRACGLHVLRMLRRLGEHGGVADGLPASGRPVRREWRPGRPFLLRPSRCELPGRPPRPAPRSPAAAPERPRERRPAAGSHRAAAPGRPSRRAGRRGTRDRPWADRPGAPARRGRRAPAGPRSARERTGLPAPSGIGGPRCSGRRATARLRGGRGLRHRTPLRSTEPLSRPAVSCGPGSWTVSTTGAGPAGPLVAPRALGARHQQQVVVFGGALGEVEEGVRTGGGDARLLHHACVLRQPLARDLAGVGHAYPSPIG